MITSGSSSRSGYNFTVSTTSDGYKQIEGDLLNAYNYDGNSV